MKIRYWIVISVLIWNVVVIITLLAASPKNIDNQNNSAIINLLSGKCMDPEGINAEHGTRVQLNDCDASSDQNWEIDNNNYLIHTASGKCLDVPGASGSANSAKLQLWDCEWDYQDTDQRWSLTSDGYLQNLFSGKCADIPGVSGTESGSYIQLWDCEFDNSSETDQRWSFNAAAQTSFGFNQSGFAGYQSSDEENYSNQNADEAQNSQNDDDWDDDGIAETEENWVANTFTPQYYLHVDEPAKVIRYAYQVSPQFLLDGIQQNGVILTVVALYEDDWAYPNIGSFLGWKTPAFQYEWHKGDAEAIEIWLERIYGPCGVHPPDWSEQFNDPGGSARCYILRRLVIHRHEHAWIYEIPAPAGIMPVQFDQMSAANVSVPGSRHAQIYVSKGKHGAYIDPFWECAQTTYQGTYSIEDWIGILETHEYCTSAYDSINAGKSILPVFDTSFNVGEANRPLLSSVDNHPSLGVFHGLDLWSTSLFCGVGVEYVTESCTSGLRTKWCGGGGSTYCQYQAEYSRQYTESELPENSLDITESDLCMQYDTDRFGSDYMSFQMTLADPNQCATACVADGDCVSYAYVPPGMQAEKAICYLKNSAPDPYYMQGVVSGLRSACLE